MKKLMFCCTISVLIAFCFSTAYAVEASMDSAFNTALNAVVGDQDNLETDTIQTYDAWRFLYNDSNLEFDAFGVTDEDVNGYISLTLQAELDAGFGYQCVGFVKAITDLGSTSTWIEGNAVTPFNLPTRNNVIATFDAYGNYDFGHVAVVLSASSTHVYVIDQNWEGTGANPVGKIIIHAIPFNGTGIADADSYSIVEY